MTDLLAFSLAALVVLATPGPTNSLLATAGATIGVRRAAIFVVAELMGYAISVLTWRLALGPMVDAYPLINAALRIVLVAYLACVAWRLWSSGSAGTAHKAITFSKVFGTTLLNPKGMLFGLFLLPAAASAQSWPAYFLTLCLLIVLVGLTWVSIGGLMGRLVNRRGWADAPPKVGAVTLALFAFALAVAR
ncbi:MAG: lysine transporter LysE [Leifsonia xyli]|jgi:threonine/homoserine/homoserine lactone efflux protein|nr:MAG: lysine transporter LysE [Leifsonia xyli]